MMTTSRVLRIVQLFVLILVFSAQWCLAQDTDLTKTENAAVPSRIDLLSDRLGELGAEKKSIADSVFLLTTPDSLQKNSKLIDSLQVVVDSFRVVIDSLGAQQADPSYLVVAAIKSISGERPEDEFFAAFWRFSYGKRFYSLANLDIALSNRPMGARSDSVFSEQRRLTDAGAAFYWDAFPGSSFREKNERSLGLGGYVKIFNEEAYFGPSFVSVELAKSAFYSSYVQVAIFQRIFPVTDSNRHKMVSEDEQIRLADQNLFFEFFINSQKETFFKYLAIRTGVLMPLTGDKGTFKDIQFRITIAVPVVDEIFSF